MIQNSGKNNSKHERLELSSKGRKSGERAKREGKGVPNSRRTTGEGSFTPSLLSCCRPSLTISIEIQANRGIDDHLGDQELLGWLTLKSLHELRSIKWCAHEDDFLITFDGGLSPNLKAHSNWIPSIPRILHADALPISVDLCRLIKLCSNLQNLKLYMLPLYVDFARRKISFLTN